MLHCVLSSPHMSTPLQNYLKCIQKIIRGTIKSHMEMVTYAPFFCLDKISVLYDGTRCSRVTKKKLESSKFLHSKKHIYREPELRTLISKTKYGT